MEVIMCVAATHLYHLDPTQKAYHKAELQHLANAMSGFRSSLARPIADRNTDALVACSVLLYHHAWVASEQDDCALPDDISFGLGSLIVLGSGTKDVLLQTFHSRTSIWDRVAIYSPKVPISEYSKHTTLRIELEHTFAQHYSSVKLQDSDPHHFEAFMQECNRLVPIISLLKMVRCGSDISLLQPDIVRFLFTFPALFDVSFIQLMKQEDDVVQIVLAYYYIALVELMPDTCHCWWSRQKLRDMQENLESRFVEDAHENVNKLSNEFAFPIRDTKASPKET
jgi:hypothetical protein